jgi:hypothetical protein
MVGLVGYAPTTPAMSMQYSTIELQSQNYISNKYFIMNIKKSNSIISLI